MMKTWKEAEEGKKIRRKCLADDVYSFPAWQARHKNERFLRLACSMEESPAWMSLGKNAIRLYFECMEWTYDAENRKEEEANEELYPRDKWTDSPYNIQDGDFFLNSAKVIASGIFKNDSTLRRAIKELVKYGFIVCIVPGKTGRKDLKAVYRMSDKWKRKISGKKGNKSDNARKPV